MPSFVCDYCQETIKKAKLDQHTQRCRNASFSCIDCYKSFKGVEYRAHFSCITEEQKYHKKPTPPPQPAKVEVEARQNTVTPPPSPAHKMTPLQKVLKKLKEPVPLKVLKKKAKKESKEAKSELKKLLKEKVKISLDSNGSFSLQIDQ